MELQIRHIRAVVTALTNGPVFVDDMQHIVAAVTHSGRNTFSLEMGMDGIRWTFNVLDEESPEDAYRDAEKLLESDFAQPNRGRARMDEARRLDRELLEATDRRPNHPAA